MSSDARRRYKVEYLKVEEPFWYLRVPEIGHATQPEGWEESEKMARDLISLLTEQDPSSFDLEFVPLPAEDQSS